MPVLRQKVLAYVTSGDRLLVFRQPEFPEAGIQVPAGTVEPGEQPSEAVMREVQEETGLADLTLVGLLGERTRDMADFGREEIQQRSFFHVRCAGDPPPIWRHVETQPSEGSGRDIVFELYWVSLAGDIPPLVADQGAMLPALLTSLAREHPSLRTADGCAPRRRHLRRTRQRASLL